MNLKNIQVTLSIAFKYDLPLSSLLNVIFHGRIISKYTFDRMVNTLSTKVLCTNHLYIGANPVGFLKNDFNPNNDKLNLFKLKKKHYQFKQYMLSHLLLHTNINYQTPSIKDGFIFLLRQHNRRLENFSELYKIVKKKMSVNVVQPQQYSFRTLMEEIRKRSMVYVVSGAGVTNLMFLRTGSVVLFSNPLGCYGKQISTSVIFVIIYKFKSLTLLNFFFFFFFYFFLLFWLCIRFYTSFVR